MTRATVVVPTFDHGPTLRYSVATALGQTVRDLEVFIIGDGVPDGAREIVAELLGDPRVRFFDHPKGPRRGERYRHEALQEARGEIVCYLSDDDLWWPNHVETMLGLLERADFAHALIVAGRADDGLQVGPLDLTVPADRETMLAERGGIPLSCAAHTLALYRRLPHGWRTSPTTSYTDRYMWKQILGLPDCRAVSSFVPTVLTLPATDRRGWADEQVLAGMDAWARRLGQPELLTAIVANLADQVARLRANQDAVAADRARAAAYARDLRGALGERQAAAAEAERYARSLEAALAEQRAAFAEAERYARALEAELARRPG